MGSLACVALIYPDFTRLYLCAVNRLESMPCVIGDDILEQDTPDYVST